MSASSATPTRAHMPRPSDACGRRARRFPIVGSVTPTGRRLRGRRHSTPPGPAARSPRSPATSPPQYLAKASAFHAAGRCCAGRRPGEAGPLLPAESSAAALRGPVHGTTRICLDDERAPFPSDAALSLCAKMAQGTSADARRVPSSKRGVPRVGAESSWVEARAVALGGASGRPELEQVPRGCQFPARLRSGVARALVSRELAHQGSDVGPSLGGTRRRRPRSECATRSGQHGE
jgi:hypothetical protein